MSQLQLLTERRFWPLFWTQFLGAFNDNLFKNALVILIAYRSMTLLGISSATIVVACAGIFIFPFFLFSATAGQLADHYPKWILMRWESGEYRKPAASHTKVLDDAHAKSRTFSAL